MNFEHPVPSQIPRLVKLWKEVFGEYDGFWELFRDTAFRSDHCRCITENGQVIAALYWFDCSCGQDRIAYIYAVATDPAHRGRGLCRKLMADVHTLLSQQGYDSAMLVPADAGLRDMYRKMGYSDCTRISEITCTAADTAIAVRSIRKEEYACLRRAMLPEQSVLQEGNSLTFLAAQVQLFAGDGFLLAAWLEDGILHGTELLGSTDIAPGILRALGCEKGIFQIPGNDTPFAMIHSLRQGAVMPEYFGLSFD